MANHTDHHDETYEPYSDCLVNGMDYNDWRFEESLRIHESKTNK